MFVKIPTSLPVVQNSNNTENMINKSKWKRSKNRKIWKIDFDDCSKKFMWSPYEFWWIFKTFFRWDPCLLKGYILFIPNTERSLEQWKWNFELMKKVNNSIAKKLGANLLNICEKGKHLVHDTIQWIHYLLNYLNTKIEYNCLRKFMYNFVVHLN